MKTNWQGKQTRVSIFLDSKTNIKDLFVLRIGESILCLLYSILISDRLNCKVVGAYFNAMQNEQWAQ